MDPGKLCRRVQLERPDKATSAAGDAVTTYTAEASVWAEVVPLSGREVLAGSNRFGLVGAATERYAEATHRFRIRWLRDLTPEWRITYDGRAWDIVAVLEIGRHEGMDVLAVARAE